MPKENQPQVEPEQVRCPKCGHQYHGNSICLNMASDNECSCKGEPVAIPKEVRFTTFKDAKTGETLYQPASPEPAVVPENPYECVNDFSRGVNESGKYHAWQEGFEAGQVAKLPSVESLSKLLFTCKICGKSDRESAAAILELLTGGC